MKTSKKFIFRFVDIFCHLSSFFIVSWGPGCEGKGQRKVLAGGEFNRTLS